MIAFNKKKLIGRVIALGTMLSFLGIAVSCSLLKSSSDDNEILHQLLNFPDFSYPIMTNENATNSGYLSTNEHLQDILELHYFNYHYWILPFIEEESQPQRRNKSIVWQRRINNDPNEKVILSVVPGDSLFFELTLDRPGYGPSGAWRISGHFIPSKKAGYLASTGGVQVRWWMSEHGFNLGVRLWNPLVLGFDHVVMDSINGGGSMGWDRGDQTSRDRFLALWDNTGHGSWESIREGSGEW